MSPKTVDNRTGWARVKSMLLGDPISSSADVHHRLSKKVALPVFASDAISSTAYATEEILISPAQVLPRTRAWFRSPCLSSYCSQSW
jgi:hypothetical protein